ncbi:unnamed protein product, partial [Meganyctiphanes norvegica]
YPFSINHLPVSYNMYNSKPIAIWLVVLSMVGHGLAFPDRITSYNPSRAPYHPPGPAYHPPEPAYHAPEPYHPPEPAYHAPEPAYHAPEPAYHAPEPYHPPEPAYHAPEPAYHAPEPAYHAPEPYHPPEPAYHAPEPYHPPVPAYSPPEHKEKAIPYSYGYAVQDDYQGVDFGANEDSDGNLIQGSYNVLLPDGRKQTVTYTADHYKGYEANVAYLGEAQHPTYT